MPGKTRNIVEDTVQLVLDCVLLDCEESSSYYVLRRRPTIRRVPHAFRDGNARFYTPQMVSIGPLHRGDEKLQEFERQKADCVKDLLMRYSCRVHSSLQQTFEECLRKVSGSIEEIKACYAEITPYSDAELAKMMVLDACFILYILYSEAELVFIENRLIDQYICCDLLLIENQIPFFVLQDVFQCINLEWKTTLVDLMRIFLPTYYIFDAEPHIKGLHTSRGHDHILGLLHELYQPAHESHEIQFYEYRSYHTATELDKSGVNFQPNDDLDWGMAMEVKLPWLPWFPWFCCKPLFRMPVLRLYDSTEFILRNLIMYEEFSFACSYVSAYVAVMDMLIDTLEDVRTLKESNVLINDLGSDEMAVTMMNNITKGNFIKAWHYIEEFRKLDGYCNYYWPSKIAELKHKYFKSPWTMIALVAGIALFAFTMLQTIFTING